LVTSTYSHTNMQSDKQVYPAKLIFVTPFLLYFPMPKQPHLRSQLKISLLPAIGYNWQNRLPMPGAKWFSSAATFVHGSGKPSRNINLASLQIAPAHSKFERW